MVRMTAAAATRPHANLTWTEAAAVPTELRPVGLWSWLVDQGSLTQRLRSRTGAGFSLRVLAESREPLRRADALRLGVVPTQGALIREVRLDVDGRAAIHAVTVIPASTLAAHPVLGTLGDRPLGDSLFDPGLVGATAQREPFEVAYLAPGHPLVDRALAAAAAAAPRASVWVRRSVVRLGVEPLLIHECFLADWDW